MKTDFDQTLDDHFNGGHSEFHYHINKLMQTRIPRAPRPPRPRPSTSRKK